VGWNEPAAIMKALDFGASAIIVPLINNAAEARKAVSACRYPPAGDRSSGPVRALQIHGPEYFSKANDEILLMAMIETKEGLNNLEEICATPGVDVICMHCASAEFAAASVKRGFDMVMITSDLASMIAGAKKQITSFHEALKGS
jgi:4-hydroxy-2-oxoheptanedioate aldolase